MLQPLVLSGTNIYEHVSAKTHGSTDNGDAMVGLTQEAGLSYIVPSEWFFKTALTWPRPALGSYFDTSESLCDKTPRVCERIDGTTSRVQLHNKRGHQ